jgi:3-hydroxybutyryl-CoA dehydrogenase
MSPRAAAKRTVYLAGEPALVREFGDVCAASGFSVVCAPGSGGGSPLPRGFRVSARVPRSAAAAAELTNVDLARKRKNLAALDARLPSSLPLLTSAVTVTAGEQAAWVRRPSRLVGFGAFPTLLGGPLVEVTAPPGTDRGHIDLAGRFFGEIGKEVSVVQDRVGLVMPRILCMLINEACFALTEGVASPGDIDTAMKLGTNHPRGPVEWANLIGIGQVAALLDALRGATGEERYRLAPLLKQMSLEPGTWNK